MGNLHENFMLFACRSPSLLRCPSPHCRKRSCCAPASPLVEILNPMGFFCSCCCFEKVMGPGSCLLKKKKKKKKLDFGVLGGFLTALAMLKLQKFALVPLKIRKTTPLKNFGYAGNLLPSSGAKGWTKLVSGTWT